MIGKTLGHYQITSEIGRGGMGEVCQAKDQKLGRDVAQKALDDLRAKITPDAKEYFQPVGRNGGWGQTWSQKPNAWKGADYVAARRAIGDVVAKLTAAK